MDLKFVSTEELSEEFCSRFDIGFVVGKRCLVDGKEFKDNEPQQSMYIYYEGDAHTAVGLAMHVVRKLFDDLDEHEIGEGEEWKKGN